MLLLNITKLFLLFGLLLCFPEWVLGSNTPILPPPSYALTISWGWLWATPLGDALPKPHDPASGWQAQGWGRKVDLHGWRLVIGSLSGLALSRGINEMMWRLVMAMCGAIKRIYFVFRKVLVDWYLHLNQVSTLSICFWQVARNGQNFLSWPFLCNKPQY